MAASNSLVVVLPAEPVTPAKRRGNRARTLRARSCIACSELAVRIKLPPGAATRRSTTAALAPRANASATKSWPSTRWPEKAKNTSPPRIRRESIAAPSIIASGSPASSWPCIACVASAIVNLAKALLQGATDLLAIRERQPTATHDLFALVPLASHQDRPARARRGQRLTDCLSPVGDQAVGAIATRPQAGLHLSHDGQGVLAARIVGRHDWQVGQLARDLAH